MKLFVKALRDERSMNAVKKTAQSSDDTVFYNAPLLVFIANDTRFIGTETDCSLAAQNMMLAAHSLGLGSCFVGRGKLIPKALIKKRIKLSPYYDINAHLAFGYPKDPTRTPPPRREETVQRS